MRASGCGALFLVVGLLSVLGHAQAAPATQLPSGLYLMTHRASTAPGSTEIKVCMAPEMFSGLSTFGAFLSPQSTAGSCKRVPGKDGAFSPREVVCTMKGGAPEMRVTWEGTPDNFVSRTSRAAHGKTPALSVETRADRLGDCPAGMRPGQIILEDGEVVDPVAWLKSALDKNAPRPMPPPIPRSLDIPETEEGPRAVYELACTKSGGRLRGVGYIFPFGAGTQRWGAFPQLGVSTEGKLIVFSSTRAESWVTSTGPEIFEFDREPTYTIRMGRDYIFTPPIVQHDGVSRPGDLMSGREQMRREARNSAKARDETYCSLIAGCFLGATDREAFLRAFEETAATGGDLRISAQGPAGPVTVRYALKGFGGIVERLRACH